MSNLSQMLILHNLKLLRNACRCACKYNRNIGTTVLINKNIYKFVALATSSTRKQCLYPLPIHYRINNYCIAAIDSNTFEKVCEETLESLCEYFEELVETTSHLISADVTYSSGVLTVNFGNPYGTYVINRQSPNQQIWLSSPVSGPKRYDFVPDAKHWIYKHDNVTLHQLLQKEIKDIVKKDIDFSRCSYSLL